MRFIKFILIVISVFFISGWFINTYIIVATKPYIFHKISDVPEVQAILVPGASVYRSGDLSPVLKSRMTAAIALGQTFDSIPLVFAGHSIPRGYNEPIAMMEFAKAQKIPKERIVLDVRGTSTYTSLLNYKKMHSPARFAIATQAYHLPRCIYIARSIGLEAYGFVADEPGGTQISKTPFREISSRLKDFFLLKFFRLFNDGK